MRGIRYKRVRVPRYNAIWSKNIYKWNFFKVFIDNFS